MGSPAYWGQLVNFQASLRKPALVPFGLFNAQDDLGFLADIPGFGETFSQATQAFSSTLNVDMSAANVITIILTADVTSSTFSYAGGTPPDGQWNYIRFVQDSTGGWTVALPTDLVIDQNFAVDSGASRVTVLPVQWNGTNWVFFGTPFSTPAA